VRFTGRVGGRRLARGRYQLVLYARDGARNLSKRAARAFRIL
jgi:hypothetical protein